MLEAKQDFATLEDVDQGTMRGTMIHFYRSLELL